MTSKSLPLVPRPADPALSPNLRNLTPARIALRRTGASLATQELLDFQLAHARARDAVHATLQSADLVAALSNLTILGQITSLSSLQLHSAAPDRATYLQRPDLGRTLSQSSVETLRSLPNPAQPPDLSIVIGDGLSSLAVERHAIPLLAELLPHLAPLSLAPICIAQQARVAIGDPIAQALNAPLSIVLIGERPGLSSPDSLGAYITWLGDWLGESTPKLAPTPRPITDADRNCISNIRAEGLTYSQAAARLLHYIHESRRLQLTGVALKDPDTQSSPHLPAGQP